MKEERLQQLIQGWEVAEDLSVEDVQRLVDKAKPEWEKVIGQMGGAAGPVYAAQVVLPGDIALDIVLTAYTEFMGDPGSYQQYRWQLVVAEGDDIRAHYQDDARVPSPVKDLFTRVQDDYERTQLIQGSPSAERTRAALQMYLRE